MNLSDKELAVKLALSRYLNEPCRICGEIIGNDSNPIYAGYSKGNESRAAHYECWKNNSSDKTTWVYPI